MKKVWDRERKRKREGVEKLMKIERMNEKTQYSTRCRLSKCKSAKWVQFDIVVVHSIFGRFCPLPMYSWFVNFISNIVWWDSMLMSLFFVLLLFSFYCYFRSSCFLLQFCFEIQRQNGVLPIFVVAVAAAAATSWSYERNRNCAVTIEWRVVCVVSLYRILF